MKNESINAAEGSSSPFRGSGGGPLGILFENDDFVVIDKPAGLLSIPDRTQSEPSLKDILLDKYGAIFTVHRLDKFTSGVIVFARNEESHKHLSQQFEERSTRKIYNGLVMGQPPQESGVIEVPITEHYSQKGLRMTADKGKPAITEYEVLESFRQFSWMQFHILTGRTHQIRVHMKHLGHPIVCDDLYGDGKPVLLSSFKRRFKLSKNEEEERPILGRLALHAAQLSFKDREENQQQFEAPLPKDLRALLQQLRKNNGK
ncbi:MAG: RluA family pseudouridine synthase [Bacteroidetes bacterium]|nr:RluA family pseudouridine synthase [Bacteroidota bacterium]